ncbi:MAG: iron-sulfur cluster repair di-iron protein [Bacteroidetes bacterium]|nr:MAG: iron-sulfur cluster repair di-iron protein [Bacteroidota bacterium]
MFLNSNKISEHSFVSEIVKQDYRTAEVFRRHDIEYCCGAKWSLDNICMMKGIDVNVLKDELEKATRNIQVSNNLNFDEWPVDFLADYIVNVHHSYMKHSMPEIKTMLKGFVEEHIQKYPNLAELEISFNQLYKEVFPHMKQEEEILFPYIKQIYHAFTTKESYASLLVRTLRKPVEEVMDKEHESAMKHLRKFRTLTNDYTAPTNACVSHRVSFAKLRELDNDLTQHIHLESNILFPKAIAIEKELLKNKV